MNKEKLTIDTEEAKAIGGDAPKFDPENARRLQDEAKERVLKGEDWKKDVIFWAEEYRSVEQQYANRKARDERMSYEEFEKWEEDARYNYRRMREASNAVNFGSRYEQDKAERMGDLLAEDSIEAGAGDFYQRRVRALNEAIRVSDAPDKEEDLRASDELYRFVGEHIYYTYDFETRKANIDYYKINRQKAHNALINHINGMDDIARKYGVKPFTFRNFATNSFAYNKCLDIGGHTNARIEYDRATVEAYCRRAFSTLYEKAERERIA